MQTWHAIIVAFWLLQGNLLYVFAAHKVALIRQLIHNKISGTLHSKNNNDLKCAVCFYSRLLSSRFCWYNLRLPLQVINQKTEEIFLKNDD